MMATSKRGLGKGLGALIPQGSVFTGGRTIVNVEIGKIAPNPRQPRTIFHKEDLQDLANSIKEQGVIEPILARLRAGKYELVAGERRLRAAKLAGLSSVPAIVKDFTDLQSLEISLIENLQREDLNPMDEAEGFARLTAEFKLTQEEVAKRVGKDRTTVTNMLRILSLPDKIKQSLRKGELSVGHARALLAVETADKQLEIWRQIIKNGLNVRDAEVLAGGGKAAAPKAKKGGRKRAYTQNTELNDLVDQLTTHLGTKVKIFGSPERGRIEIEYYSKEELERILEIIMPRSTVAPPVMLPETITAAPELTAEAPPVIQ
jgi:ParB family chromosome partitioning protein